MDIWQRTVFSIVTLAYISGWVNLIVKIHESGACKFSLQRPFTVELKNITYELFHPEIVDFNVTIKNNTFFDVHINFLRDISQPFIDLTVLHDSGNGNYDMVYTNKTVDICLFLINKKYNILFDIFYKMMEDYVEMPKRCPIRKVI